VAVPGDADGVKGLEPPDSHFLQAAHGWLELGCAADAQAELAQLSERWRAHPDVLEVRWLLCAQVQDWAAAAEIARAEQAADAENASGSLHLAYAQRRLPGGGLALARETLLAVLPQFPQEPVIPYNLACYACQLGQLDEAQLWLAQALGVGEPKMIQQMALTDPDLRPLWPQIAAWPVTAERRERPPGMMS